MDIIFATRFQNQMLRRKSRSKYNVKKSHGLNSRSHSKVALRFFFGRAHPVERLWKISPGDLPKGFKSSQCFPRGYWISSHSADCKSIKNVMYWKRSSTLCHSDSDGEKWTCDGDIFCDMIWKWIAPQEMEKEIQCQKSHGLCSCSRSEVALWKLSASRSQWNDYRKLVQEISKKTLKSVGFSKRVLNFKSFRGL